MVNIATEFGFVAIYLSIFHGLQTSTMRKVSVLTVFSARLLYVHMNANLPPRSSVLRR